MAKHIRFATPTHERFRPDPCRLGSGRLKWSYTTEEQALEAKAIMIGRGASNGRNLEAYTCPVHGWHLGNRRLLPKRYRVIERRPDLTVELGDRVVAQINQENHQRDDVRIKSIAARFRRHGRV